MPPFIVAHRAGNDLACLRRAGRARFVEADVHLRRGRLEVRHLKALGPFLWDRWYLAPRHTPRLLLAELLAEAGGDVRLMLDLKGVRRRVARAVRAELSGHRASVVVCSRSWRLLDAFAEEQRIYSVGSRRQLRALRRRFAGRRLAGVSIHRRLLDERTVRDLQERASLIVSWPVETAEEALALGRWGVDGVTTTRFAALAEAIA
ncbi:MAG TPA: hypothetical protein VNS09_20480 [Solirubrobacter sp.]|nr:hypothetical protein [Solirubrobacter sp.]